MEMNKILQAQRLYGDSNNIPILREAEVPLFEAVVEKYKPHAIVEVGTAIGYSTLLLAKHMSPTGHIMSIELDEARHEKAKDFIGQSSFAEQIALLLGDAGDILQEIEGTFDFVFLDGPKGQYLKQLELLRPHLQKDALILADNVLFRGYVRSEGQYPKRFKTIVKRLEAYLDFVEQDELFDTEIIPIGDGMSVSRWKGLL